MDTVASEDLSSAQITTDSDRLLLTGTGENQCIPTVRWAEPAEHALAILETLQGPGGRTGTIPFREMTKIHLDVCLERNIEPIGWTAVGRELRKLIGAEKTYGYDANGKRIRIYRIPPKGQQPCLGVAIDNYAPRNRAMTNAPPKAQPQPSNGRRFILPSGTPQAPCAPADRSRLIKRRTSRSAQG